MAGRSIVVVDPCPAGRASPPLSRSEAIAVLFEYVCRVRDATGVRNGPAHVEVMITAEGPRLIEVGGRTAGAEQQELSCQGRAGKPDHSNGPPPSG